MKKQPLCLLWVILVGISLTTYAQRNQEGIQNNTIENTNGKITIGIGMIVDTPSQISCQYAFYSLLHANPIITGGSNPVYPILTLKRGLTSYYIEGIYSTSSINLKLWRKNNLVKSIHFTPKEIKDESPGKSDLREVYNQLTNAITGNYPDSKLSLKEIAAFESSDKLVSKDAGSISTFIYASSSNYIPNIDFKKDLYNLYNLYTEGNLENEFNELKELKGKKFKFKTFEEYVDKTYPELSVLFQTPEFIPKNSLEQAQLVQRLYKLKSSDHFFFTSKYVDDKAKIACRKVVFPLWKRPGTIVTYYMAGENFLKEGYTDAAIEAYYSALLMSDASNTYPSVVYYLKSKIYNGLAEAQTKEGNTGSAAIAQSLSDLYKSLINANTIKERSREFKKLSSEVSSYFGKIEQNAYNARSQKRDAFWNTITSVVTMTASAANDGMNGLNTLSPETQALLDVASDNMDVESSYKINSLTSSAEAAQAFTNTYGDVVKHLQNTKNEISPGKPILSTDFVKRLSDNDLSAEKKEDFVAFSNKVPAFREAIAGYFNASKEDEKKSILQDIFKRMATMELTISIKESMGEKPGFDILSSF
jgi:hypothetical protein